MANVIDNKNESRFELEESGELAYANYGLSGGVLTIKYVFAPEALRGSGIAGRLMSGVMQHAKENSLKIIPVCGYAVSWLRRHPEYGAMLA